MDINASVILDALRRVRSAGNVDQWEIVVADQAQLALLYEYSRLYEIPCSFDPGVPLHYSKAARTVMCWLRWVSEGFAGRHLIRMMYDGIPAPQDEQVDGVRGGRLQMASLLRRASFGSGRDPLLPAVDAFIEQLACEADDVDAKVLSQARANRVWLARLLEATPRVDADGMLSLHALADGARLLVTTLCRDAYPGEELALARVAALTAELRGETDRHLPVTEAAALIIGMLQNSVVPMVLQQPGHDAIPTTSPLPGNLHVTLRPSGSGRDIIRVETRTVTTEAVRFTDAETTVTNAETTVTNAETTVTNAETTVTNAETTVTNAETAAKARLLPGDPPLGYGETWLRRCAEEKERAVCEALRAQPSLLHEGALAAAARKDDIFTVWDGNIGPGLLPLDSSSFPEQALRTFDRCAYAFFLEYVLDVREPSPWKDPQGPATTDTATPLSEPERARLQESLQAALENGAFPHAPRERCDDCRFREICTATIEADIPEIAALRDAMRILTDPENPLFVVAFLRGPLCGADDRALLAYRQAGGLFAFNARAFDGTDARIADGLQYIKDTVRLVRSNPPGMVVASMIDRLALHAAIVCGPRGWPGAAALQDLLEHVLALSVAGWSIPDIVGELDVSDEES